jgi:CheY-like chemotaxis protein
MEKTLLLIDDEPIQKKVLENLAEHLRTKEGINVLTLYVDPNERDYLNDEKDPDLDKLVIGITEKLKGLRPNLIVVDHYYGDASFTGLNVIEKLRSIKKFSKSAIFLISGKRDKIVREVFEDEKIPTNERVNKLAKIIDYGIEKFLDKEFKSEAIESLKTRDLKDVLPSKLRELDNGKIHVLNPRYRELTLDQLADMIDVNDSDALGIINEMFDLTLAHYVKINEGLQ